MKPNVPTGRIGQAAWVRELVLRLSSAAMEACWVYPWALLGGNWGSARAAAPLLPMFDIYLLLVAAEASSRLIARRVRNMVVARAIDVALGVLAVFSSLRMNYRGGFPVPVDSPLAMLAAGLGFLLWWRGSVNGAEAARSYQVEQRFKWGLALLVGALLLERLPSTAAGSRALSPATLASAIGYLSAGLVSLSLARWNDWQTVGGRAGTDRNRASGRHWFGLLVGALVLLLAVSAAFASLLSLDFLVVLTTHVFRPLGTLAQWILYGMALTLGLLLEPLIFLIRRIARPAGVAPRPGAADLSFLEQLRSMSAGRGLPPWLATGAKWVATGLAVGLLVLWLARAVTRWFDGAHPDDVEEERESVWSWKPPKDALLAWLARWRAGRRNRLAPDTQPGRAESPGPGEASGAMLVREVYRGLLALGRVAGAARRLQDTPYEYLPTVQALLGPPEDLGAITEAYVRARYGACSIDQAEVEQVLARWRRVLEFRRDSATGTAGQSPRTAERNAADDG